MRDGTPVVLDGGQHYEGGSPLQTALLIKNATRHDQGTYSCVLENAVGKAESLNVAYVAVFCE
jgi:Immunoglobulin I-set domain